MHRAVGPVEEVLLKNRNDVLRTVKVSRFYREFRSHLSSLHPLDLWSEGPYGFAVFRLRPDGSGEQGGLLLFSTLLPDKLLKVVSIRYLFGGGTKEEVHFDTIPNGLLLIAPPSFN